MVITSAPAQSRAPLTVSGMHLADLAELSPAMLWRGDAEGRCVYLNAAMRRFWGLEDPDYSRFSWSDSLLEEDRSKVFGPFAEGMAARRPFRCEARYRRADGAIRTLQTRAEPYFDTDGTFLGMVGVNEDVTELRLAERNLVISNGELTRSIERLGHSAQRFELAALISGLSMSEHDENLRYVWAHNLEGEWMGRTPSELVGRDVGEPLEAILREAIETNGPTRAELAIVVGDQRIWCDIQAAPSRLSDGRNGVMACALDVTARKLNEEKLSILAQELNHRVKNVFSLVQAVVRQSSAAHDVSGEFIRAVEARLGAMAAAQDALLVMSDNRLALDALARSQLSHLNSHAITIEGPAVTVPGRAAPYIALALHELGTNAVKYGSLSCPNGQVSLRWEVADGHCSIVWQESGGPAVEKQERSGFGSVLLNRVAAAALGGQTEHSLEPQGVRWSARFPVGRDIRMARQPDGSDKTD